MAPATVKAIRKQRLVENRAAVQPQGINKPFSSNLRRSSRIAQRRAEEALQHTLSLGRPTRSPQGTKRNHDHLNESLDKSAAKKAKHLIGGEQKEPDQYSHIEHWRYKGQWPKELFEPQPYPIDNMLARKKSEMFSRKRSLDGSIASSKTSVDMTREEKCSPYKDPKYEQQLKAKGVYMKPNAESPQGLGTFMVLFDEKTSLPENTGFDDHLFLKTCEGMRGKNEARVIRDLTELIVPSAEKLIARGEIEETAHLIESVNEGWSSTIPITSVRPQPDFSVGFEHDAFTEEQLAKLRPILGDERTEVSCILATHYMLFPFLTCEVKCGTGALDVADRQNAHSMAIAVRAVVELFRYAHCAEQLHRNLLAFSISHDDCLVRIYGHYPLIQGDKETYHRHLIDQISIRSKQGQYRWMAYKFVKGIYSAWAPKHLERIHELLDKLPSSSTGLPPELSTGLSQQVDDSHISRHDDASIQELGNEGANDNRPDSSQTPGTSISTPKTSSKPQDPNRKQTSNKKQR